MCGPFTASGSWAGLVSFSQPLDCSNTENREVTYRVLSELPVILWDVNAIKRRVVPMRWGAPNPQDWRPPPLIHASAETIDTAGAFAQAFADGQRGIVLVKAFGEGPGAPDQAIQHTTSGGATVLAAAFVWRRFNMPGNPNPLLACVLCTVPANQLMRGYSIDRMPAFLAPEDWGVWLGECIANLDQVKACLKTVENVNCLMEEEPYAAEPRKPKPIVPDPGGVL